MSLQIEDLKIPFVNLRTLSHYTMQLAIGTPEEHLQAARAAGHSGIALTDNASIAACIQLHKLSKAKDFPAVIGCNMYITEDLDIRDPDHRYDRILIFIRNWQGYQNLCRLITVSSHDDHFYYKPRISFAELFAHRDGLMISTSDLSSPFGHAILNETGREEELLKLFHQEFGSDLYCEISLADGSQRWNSTLRAFVPEDNKQEIVNLRMRELSLELGIEQYLVMPSYMPKREQFILQKIVISNSPLGKDGWHFHEPQFTMSVADLYERKQAIAPYISDTEFIQLCKNSTLILEKAKEFRPIFKPLLLKVDYEKHPASLKPELEETLLLMEEYFAEVDPGFSEMLALTRENKNMTEAIGLFPDLALHLKEFQTDEALRLCLKIILDLGKIDFNNPAARKRVLSEMKTIQLNGVFRFCDYFLPLEDVVRFVRSIGEERGFGRGSGGSSEICYAMDISDVDPLFHNLDFDRFCTTVRLGRYATEISGIPKPK